jgi:ribosomal protein S26
MMKCKQVSEQLLLRDAQTMSVWTRLQLRLHLAMCGSCAALARQLELLSAAARRLRAEYEPPADFEERIIRRLSR